MGWSCGGPDGWGRYVGYGVPAYCDHPECDKEIDRGLGYVCAGEQPYGGEGCGLYFCGAHAVYSPRLGDCCQRCASGGQPFTPKPEHPEWLRFQLRSVSWQEWRDENPKKVLEIRATLYVITVRREMMATLP